MALIAFASEKIGSSGGVGDSVSSSLHRARVECGLVESDFINLKKRFFGEIKVKADGHWQVVSHNTEKIFIKGLAVRYSVHLA